MPLEVHPFDEADFAEFVPLQYSAFSSGIAQKLNPAPHTPEYIQKSIEKQIESFRNEPDLHFIKVIDTDLGGKLIAGAKWRINETERTEEQAQAQIPSPTPEQEGNEAAKEFLGYLASVRKRWMGTKPFYCEFGRHCHTCAGWTDDLTSVLHLLVTHPEHQRRGAGTLLLRWGTERSDQAQLPAFLEASEEGLPLYEKLGFKAVEKRTFDLSKYGGTGFDSNTAMIRQPAS